MNRNTKTLSLRKETLTELTHVELDNAAGGIALKMTDTVWRQTQQGPCAGMTIERLPEKTKNWGSVVSRVPQSPQQSPWTKLLTLRVGPPAGTLRT